jgi:ubiquinone/menaquinone biosynthesis C-methylase UbiE
MIAEAQRRTISGSSNVSFRVGNGLDLPFESRSIDRLTATQVLFHIPDTAVALAEMWRVLAPGGLVAFGEIDCGTVTVECTDRELGDLDRHEPRDRRKLLGVNCRGPLTSRSRD